MKKVLTALTSLALLSPVALAQVENGEFENWTGNTPDGWTTIDTGISVSQSTAYSFNGTSSAAINVTTGTQSSTDFRQTVSVTAGQSYDFSARIYHTEGNVRARLYVNGYYGYSNENLTNQWQQISQSYTASSTGTIEVGLRFYDVSGFDGAEIVYVDSFEPTDAGTGGGTGGGTGSCTDTSAQFNLLTDNYASETSWQLTDSSNATIASGDNFSNNTSYTEELCLADGDYTFQINDSYGDGICCGYGSGAYSFDVDGTEIFAGGEFNSTATHSFTVGSNNGGGTGGGTGGGSNSDLGVYYQTAEGLSGYALKTALHDIIKGHSNQGYGALWTFYEQTEIDNYYENDGSILDIYSEAPNGSDPFNFTKVTDQCGTYSGEADCYNREHSFPKSWFGGKIEPMNSDAHHIFATDGYVNAQRGSFPYGEVGSATYTSSNGSKLGSAASGLGYSGTVFEPIDEFKGDLARAYFYMATRYEDVISGWQSNSTYGDAVLNGSSDQVFESWFLALMKQWHNLDPVSQKEIDRNNAAELHQANRNPFVDHPEFVSSIWGN
ncbi:endonuclease [Planctobacterium marinum]|uniref:Endonuclease I n=1 Tax=Planctobacterium marinum TaxID=1631968 RepID=A0AA48KTF7_9ALTE|nr:endonuclease I [Planctobacterium marinum]